MMWAAAALGAWWLFGRGGANTNTPEGGSESRPNTPYASSVVGRQTEDPADRVTVPVVEQ